MNFFSFGKKKRRSTKGKSVRKPPAALLRKCKRHRIKCTMKKGGKRVYRKTSVLKKLLRRKMKKMKKARKHRKVHRRRAAGFGRRRRRSGFGMGSPFLNPDNYGYNQKVQQYPQTLSQSSSVVDSKSNLTRPEGMTVDSANVPVYGVNREFFGQKVPTQVPANWNFMGQPNGSLYPVGAPFYGYTKPINSFGKKLKRYNVSGSGCNGLKKRVCHSNPNCTYTKRGCRRRSGTKTKGLVYEGPSLSSFGKKKYNVAGSACNGLKKRVCRSNPNCSYTKRGCRRRSGTKTKGLIYEGPSLASYGRRRRRRN